MKLNAVLKVISKETKTGTSAKTGKDWAIDEYLLLEDLERDDGSRAETYVVASASQMISELEVGGVYDCTLFLTSRESNGKYYTSFRITHSILVNLPEPKTNDEVAIETMDEVPF